MVRHKGIIFAAESPPPSVDPTEVAPIDPLPQLIRESDVPLFTLKTVFPFVLFTDKIIIRVNHIDVVHGVFFWSATSTRLQLQDIRQVTLQFNPFFATLDIVPQGPLEQTMTISFLWKEEAKRAKRIIAGLMEGHLKKVDFSQYHSQELMNAVEDLGKASE